MVGPAARGRVGTGRYPVRFPPRAECVFRRKKSKKLRFRILGVESLKSRVFLDGKQLTRTARPGPVFAVHRKPLRRRGLRGGISIVVGPAACGRVGTGR